MPFDFFQITRFTLRSTLSLMCAVWVGHLSAEQVVYKCGQALTNLPDRPEVCQKLEIANSTQIEGTRVQNFKQIHTVSKAKEVQVESTPVVLTSPQEVHQRHAQARTILEDERQKLLSQHAELVRNYKQDQPNFQPNEAIKTNLLRIERDLQALSRELARYGAPMSSAQAK